jgi:hypothetical protein
MSISSLSAVSAIYGTAYLSPNASYAGPPGNGSAPTTSTSVTLPTGATVTTVRGAAADIVSVTTQNPNNAGPLPQASESTVDITA